MVKNSRILTSDNFYQIVVAVSLGLKNYNSIAKRSGIDPKNINKYLRRMYFSKTNIFSSVDFLTREYINDNDVRYYVNTNGMLKFIITDILNIPFILKRGLSRNLEKYFRTHFFMIGKYYNLKQFFNYFISKSFKEKSLQAIKKMKFNETFIVIDDWLYKDWRKELEKMKSISNEDKFYIACNIYTQEKIIKT